MFCQSSDFTLDNNRPHYPQYSLELLFLPSHKNLKIVATGWRRWEENKTKCVACKGWNALTPCAVPRDWSPFLTSWDTEAVTCWTWHCSSVTEASKWTKKLSLSDMRYCLIAVVQEQSRARVTGLVRRCSGGCCNLNMRAEDAGVPSSDKRSTQRDYASPSTWEMVEELGSEL